MISKELEDLIKDVEGKFIIVEGGKARYVAMGFNEFQKLVSEKKPVQTLTEEELIDRINADISLWREGQSKDENIVLDEIDDLEDIEYV